MRLSIAAAAVLAVLSSPLPALAKIEKPTEAHKGQWWTNSKGCRYSRTGTPGETMWFLITNTARKGCPTYITVRSHTGMYKAHGNLIGS